MVCRSSLSECAGCAKWWPSF